MADAQDFLDAPRGLGRRRAHRDRDPAARDVDRRHRESSTLRHLSRTHFVRRHFRGGRSRSGLSEERTAARNRVEKPAAAQASEKPPAQQTASLTTKRSNEIDEAIMPDTAARRGLLDPFDPQKALPEAAKFLAELRSEFGNLGVAAAAYNAGPERVCRFIGRRGSLPTQTRHYVRAITGYSVDKWATLGREKDGFVKPKEQANFSIGRVDRKVSEASLQREKVAGLTTASVDQSGSGSNRVPAPPPQSLIAPDQYILQAVLSTPEVPTPKPKPSTARAETSSAALMTSKITSVTRRPSALKTTALRSGSFSPDEELSISYSPYPHPACEHRLVSSPFRIRRHSPCQ